MRSLWVMLMSGKCKVCGLPVLGVGEPVIGGVKYCKCKVDDNEGVVCNVTRD